jgi:hypothetical protein
VEADKGYHYFVASWRGLWSWNSYRVAEGGSNTARLKCQQSNCSANKRHRARFSRRHRSIAVPCRRQPWRLPWASSQSCGRTVPKSHYFSGGSAAISTGWPPPMPWGRGCCCNLLKLNYWEESHA